MSDSGVPPEPPAPPTDPNAPEPTRLAENRRPAEPTAPAPQPAAPWEPGPYTPPAQANPYGAPQSAPPAPAYGQQPTPPPAYGQQPPAQPAYGQQPAYGAPQNPYGQQGGYPGQQANPYGAPVNPYGAQPAGYSGGAYASWFQRVGAYLIDALIAFAVTIVPIIIAVVILQAGSSTTVDQDGYESPHVSGGALGAAVLFYLIGAALGLAVFIWNQCLKQGKTGYTVGKGVLGIKVISESTGQPIGGGMSFVRYLCHILDSLVCYIGFLWPLWDSKRQTFADKIVSTVVIQQPKS